MNTDVPSTSGNTHFQKLHSEQVLVMGVPSDRPELGIYTATMQQNKQWTSYLRLYLELCHAAVTRQSAFCHLLQRTTSPETSYMFLLEKSIMDMAISGLSEGCVYGVVFRQGRLIYMRFFESGIFSGFFKSKGLDIMKQMLACDINDLFWENSFSSDDIKAAEEDYFKLLSKKRKKLPEPESQKLPSTGRRYSEILSENKNSIRKSLEHLLHHIQTNIFQENNIECLGVMVSVEKKKSYKDKQSANYFSASKYFDGTAFQAAFESHRTEGCMCQQVTFTDVFVPLEHPVSWDQQLQYISMFPNWHKWQHKTIRKENNKPASLRNQVLYNYREGNMDNVYSVCSKYKNIAIDQAQSASTFECLPESSTYGDIVPPASKRKRRKPTRHHQFSSDNIAEERSCYDKFKYAMIENGHVIWRRSAANVNIFTMNEVSMTTGLVQEDCYVHLTKTDIDNTTELFCSCGIIPQDNLDEVDLSDVKCCHMRFFNEFIIDHIPSLLNNSSRSENKVIEKLEATKDQINEPICRMPTASDKTLKFSVYCDDDKTCTFVHITDNSLSCQSGFCHAMYSSSKRKVQHLDKTETICPHLNQLKVHADKWMDLLVITADSSDSVYLSGDEDEEDVIPPALAATAAEDIKGHRFNEETGLWEYPSLSRHIPSQDGSLLLQQAIQLRHTFYDANFGRDIYGYLKAAPDGGYYELQPPNNPDMCNCGAGYAFPNGETIAVSHISTVYTHHGPVKHKIWYRRCLSGTRECDIGPGEKEAIHFLTRDTGAGDEIGWDFVDHVLNSYISFGSYCTIMNSLYKRVSHNSASFMSNNTFIAWFFSWISKFNLEYRQTCSICKFTPKMLAADGTKIGINIRHSTVVAIETPTNDFTVDPCHRRNERAFISFAQGDHDSNGKSQSRNHLLYLSKRVLGTLDSADEIPLEEETKRNDILLQHVDRGFQPLLNIFMRNGCCNRVLRKLAVLFTLLSSNHSISSIIPHRFVDDFQSILNLIRKNSNFNTNFINRVAKFSPEIRDVLFAVKNSDICSAT
ncbi:hypothetical protein ACJMK2_025975 [Sinanodonta woodiana]|uniref:Uncharacterized protein n=1 Tax=Sinanodonta woodiana TaxID=1069815 RepID=A0ABD3XI51_SINWO